MSAKLPVRLAAAGVILAVLSALWVPLGPLYVEGLDAVLSLFTSRGLEIETRDQSIYLIASEFPNSDRQTNIHFHAFLLSYGYLVAVGLCVRLHHLRRQTMQRPRVVKSQRVSEPGGSRGQSPLMMRAQRVLEGGQAMPSLAQRY